jgi:hypothetical protein
MAECFTPRTPRAAKEDLDFGPFNMRSRRSRRGDQGGRRERDGTYRRSYPLSAAHRTPKEERQSRGNHNCCADKKANDGRAQFGADRENRTVVLLRICTPQGSRGRSPSQEAGLSVQIKARGDARPPKCGLGNAPLRCKTEDPGWHRKWSISGG